jgi:hypothetical protein
MWAEINNNLKATKIIKYLKHISFQGIMNYMVFLHRPFAKSQLHLVRKDPAFIDETLDIFSSEEKAASFFSFCFFSFSFLYCDYCSFKSTKVLWDSRFFLIQAG